jgi:hypothetical protein
MSKKKKPKFHLEDMIMCPYCKAYSYPRFNANPVTEEDRTAVYCGSCRANLRPYMLAMEEYERKMKETLESEPTEDTALILENEEGKEVYVDSAKIMEKALTNIDPSVIVDVVTDPV